MTVFQVGDKVRIAHGAYNIADHRWGRVATVTRIDANSTHLPVRVEHGTSEFSQNDFNWTNHESLVLVEAANTPEKTGAEILNRMVALKAAIVVRDEAIKDVVEQTEALDKLLVSVGLKRGEEIPAEPVAPTGKSAYDAWKDGTIDIGDTYQCTSDNIDFYTKGKVYTVTEVDEHDDDMPIAFEDNDGDDMYPEVEHLKLFLKFK
jgi:hypothetical protein